MLKILIVEDDKKLREELKLFLSKNGYEVYVLSDFSNTIKDILDLNVDLLLLDINLPYTDGQYICKEIRKKSNLPIIIITSRDNELDELIGLNYGADYYVTKPFNLQILLAKITSILRRAKNTTIQDKLDCGNFILNLSKSTIEKDGKVIELTKNEFRILQYLVKNNNKIVSRDSIIEFLWDSDSFIDDNTLTVNINRLRNKLQELELKNILETRRGQGYILFSEEGR